MEQGVGEQKREGARISETSKTEKGRGYGRQGGRQGSRKTIE